MSFRRVTVGNNIFGAPVTSSDNEEEEEIDATPSPPHQMVLPYNPLPYNPLNNFCWDSIDSLTLQENMFLRILVLCNTVVVDGVVDDTDPNSSKQYQAESPDEIALVEAADSIFNWRLINKEASDIVIQIQLGDEIVTERWEVLAINAFTSERRRMSILVRSPPELGSACMLLVKGGDSSMFSVATPEYIFDSEYHREVESIKSHIDLFARDGLRTLVFGYRNIEQSEVDSFLKMYHQASNCIGEMRAAELAKLANLVEANLTINSAIGIEDKLQDGVPETIVSLLAAGIKLWVLTGDKTETAINIGYSSGVINPSEGELVIDDDASFQIANEFMR